jgi:hypothetical protein
VVTGMTATANLPGLICVVVDRFLARDGHMLAIGVLAGRLQGRIIQVATGCGSIGVDADQRHAPAFEIGLPAVAHAHDARELGVGVDPLTASVVTIHNAIRESASECLSTRN